MRARGYAVAVGLILLTTLLLGSQFEFGSAGMRGIPLLSSKSDCEGMGGSWSGSSDDVGTCTYAANSAVAIQACGSDHIYYETIDPDFVKTTSCESLITSPEITWSEREPEPEIGSKCKLIEIDPILYVGRTFNAKWIGIMNSIRFRQAGAGLEFITMIPGTLTYEQVHPEHDHLHRAGDFRNGFLLEPGRWEATCWGPEGTFGTAFVVTVQKP